MGELIDDLLALSKVGRAELRRDLVDLSSIASSIAGDLTRTDPGRSVAIEIQPAVTARVDSRLIRAALENLFANAWKFTVGTPDGVIEFGANERDDGTVYFVRDNGSGFDMKYVAKLFQPFQRLHSESDFPGTGIGLATVHRIIDRHGGRVWAEGCVGVGATVSFTIGSSSAEGAS
jgi:light-regulated signal transduction histidine kinase (bacteriophytochrome)